MADLSGTGSGVVCDERCGCPVPCPGGVTCRCYTSTGLRTTGEGDPTFKHKRCTCGRHCGCNPCNCNESVSAAAGCKCGPGCTCGTCA